MKRMLYGLLAAAILLSGCAAQQEEREIPELIEPVGVKTDTAAVERGDLYTMSVSEGSVVAVSTELSFEIDGVIGTRTAYPGQWVEEGDTILELDQTGLEERMDDINRQVEYIRTNGAFDDSMAEIDIEELELKLARRQAMGDATQKDIELLEMDIEEARLKLRQAQELRDLSVESLLEELKLLEADYGRNKITAPFAGHVYYSDSLVAGSSVQAGKPVAYIANPEDLRVVVSEYFSENSLSHSDYYAMIGDRNYELTYEPMSREEMTSIVLAGNSLPTRFRIAGPQEDLDEVKAGMYAILCIEGEKVRDVLKIPVGALYTASGERYVYVQGEWGRERRVVTVGAMNGLEAEITDGLEEGEIVYVKE